MIKARSWHYIRKGQGWSPEGGVWGRGRKGKRNIVDNVINLHGDRGLLELVGVITS